MSRTVLITGTSTGIGAATAARLARGGWTVFACVRRSEDGDRLKREVTGDVRPVLLDVTNAEQIASVAEELTSELGDRGLDALVNNAGVAAGGAIEYLTSEEWRSHFDVNVFGLVDVTRAFLPLLSSAQGRVVNISSIAGRGAAPFTAPYSAGKHAVEAITMALRFEVEHLGMKVICVEPGEIKTEIWAKADETMARMTAEYSDEQIARYDDIVTMMYGFTHDGATNGIPADRVAEVVERALTADNPKHRYLVGPDAKVVGIVSRLPDRLAHVAAKLFYARWRRIGRKVRP